MDTNVCITKSFYWLSHTLSNCFGCKYCRAQLNESKHYTTLPTEINPIFKSIPVVINLDYGDPLLQIDTTKEFLDRLEAAEHIGPVILITKGDISQLLPFRNKLQVNIALSTIGGSSELDCISHKNFLSNLEHLNKFPENVKFSCEFRPIIYNINDGRDIIEPLFKLCSDNNLPIGYSGLQGTNDLVTYWSKQEITLQPFPGFNFSVKKPISDSCFALIRDCSITYNVPIFKKTSCLISYVNNLPRDYNAHYYRPNEMGCKNCVMHSKCTKFKQNLSLDPAVIRYIIPFDFELVHRTKHKCLMHDTCPNPHADCTRIEGNLIKIDETITTADVRLIKWLTGYTVIAPFYESSLINNKWKL